MPTSARNRARPRNARRRPCRGRPSLIGAPRRACAATAPLPTAAPLHGCGTKFPQLELNCQVFCPTLRLTSSPAGQPKVHAVCDWPGWYMQSGRAVIGFQIRFMMSSESALKTHVHQIEARPQVPVHGTWYCWYCGPAILNFWLLPMMPRAGVGPVQLPMLL